MDINQFQKVLMSTYAQGEFAHITTRKELDECGDTLFIFLMLELATKEDCDSTEEAIKRLTCAVNDINDVIRNLGGGL